MTDTKKIKELFGSIPYLQTAYDVNLPPHPTIPTHKSIPRQPIYTVSKQGDVIQTKMNTKSNLSKVDKKRREMLLSKIVSKIDSHGMHVLDMIADDLYLAELFILNGVTEHGMFRTFDFSDILFEEETLRRKDLLLIEYRCEIL